MNVRFGVAIVGPTGAGKTEAYTMLTDAMSNESTTFQTVKRHVLNPKCITMGELYGEFNPLTLEWTDGLASSLMRAAVSGISGEKEGTMWMAVFDGPIDALWIENMNTVLDDNMTLCLANGERIKLRKEMKCLFEVQDLEVASPATVSRLGVLYMTPEDLGWIPYIRSWVSRNMTFEQDIHDLFMDRVKSILADSINLATKRLDAPIRVSEINLAQSFCALFGSLMRALQNDIVLDDALLDKLFAFATIWSVGASIAPSEREKFDAWAREALDSGKPMYVGIPSNGLVFDFFVDAKLNTFRHWQEEVPKFTYDQETPFLT